MKNRLEQRPSVCLEGYLLVASPHWQHELFGRSVCLVVHHSHQGAIGVFLNRGFEADAPGLWKHLAGEQPIVNQASVHFGGPQSGPVVAVHNRKELAEYTSVEGVYFAAQLEHLQELVTSSADDSTVKIIVGQADWKPGALDCEFADGKWLPLNVSPGVVFADDSLMWRRAMREIGNQYVVSVTGSRGQPKDILSN